MRYLALLLMLVGLAPVVAVGADCRCQAYVCTEIPPTGPMRTRLFCHFFRADRRGAQSLWEERHAEANAETFDCDATASRGDQCARYASGLPYCEGRYTKEAKQVVGPVPSCPAHIGTRRLPRR